MLRTRATSMLVDTEKAKEFLACPFPRQRPMGKKVTARYADEMKRGLWQPGKPISFALLTDAERSERYLIDGQHRLNAVIISGVPQEFAVVEVDCKSVAELNALYYTTDRGKSRQPGDVYAAAGILDDLQVTRTQMNAIGAAVKFIVSNFRPKGDAAIADDDLLDAILQYEDGILGYLDAIAGGDSLIMSRLYRSAVMSVGIVTFQYAAEIYGEQKVEEFWEGVSLDDGLRKGDPRKVLREHIVSTQMPNSSSMTKTRLVSAAVQSRYAAHCFNAWVQNKEYKADTKRASSKVTDATAPIHIMGTPWNGSEK